MEEIKVEVGGEEVLSARMAELGIDQNKLQQDIKDELLIQKLLDAVFEEKNIEISEEEIKVAYDAAGGVEAGLPPLDEVRPEVEGQLRSAKEQTIVSDLLTEIRDDADIQIKEDDSSVSAPAPAPVPIPMPEPTEEDGGEEVAN